jgi:hypothetical protein
VFSPVWAFWTRRRRLAGQEHAIREMRALFSGSVEFWPDPAPVLGVREQFQIAAADETGLGARGYASLGEIAMIARNKPFAVMRAFVDGAATTFAFVIVSLKAYAPPTFMLESHTDNAEWGTIRSTRRGPHCVDAPFSHTQALSLDLDALLAKHRELALGGAGEAPLVRCTTTAELCALLERKHELVVRWRGAQPSDALLQADLREILGARYGTAGPRWTERLSAPLPSARLRRRQ